jgi:ferritin
MGYMRRIFNYINDTGAQAIIPALDHPLIGRNLKQ